MKDVYQEITDTITKALEAGTIPWQKGWLTTADKNITTDKPYRGINTLLLSIAANKHSFTSPYWLTFNQCRKLGGKVLKGSKGTRIYFWKPITKQSSEAAEEKSISIVAKKYTLFNIDQLEGIKVPEIKINQFTPIERATNIIDKMTDKPEIRHRGNKACYSRVTDIVTMPLQESFKSNHEYYSTLFHEIGHATGHRTRLDRFNGGNKLAALGDTEYSKEELVAEFTASFLSSEAGILQATIENQTAYIQGWLHALKNDKKLLVSASSKAQKAADYVLNN